jgi:hypothetical protein
MFTHLAIILLSYRLDVFVFIDPSVIAFSGRWWLFLIYNTIAKTYKLIQSLERFDGSSNRHMQILH